MLFNACRQVTNGLANFRGSTLLTATIIDDTALRDIKNAVFKIKKISIDN